MKLAGNSQKQRDWAAHVWLGCDLFAWLRLLAHGRFQVGWKQAYVAAIATATGAAHTFLRYAQNAAYGDRVRRMRIEPPVFILGHWRSGTTHLHELLIQDSRHSFPNTYQCFDPSHLLLTERIIKKYFGWMLPARRVMDNMAVGWDRPQEDEFALCLLGVPSPYGDIAFPNTATMDSTDLDLDGLPRTSREAWKRTYYRFLQTLTFRDPRRLVLKSPPHMCRIPTLLELFPDARFVHIVRDPYEVFPSTVHLWRTLYRTQGLQTPTFAGLEDRVFKTFSHMYRRLEATRSLVRPDRFHEIKYEDLIRDPVGEMRKLYERLDLGEFETVRPNLEAYLATQARYEKNKWELTQEQHAEIAQLWADVIVRYGY